MKDADSVKVLADGDLLCQYGALWFSRWFETYQQGDCDAYWDEVQVDAVAEVPGLGFGDDICVLWRGGKPAYWVIRDGQFTPNGRRCLQFAVQHRPVLDWLP